MTVLRLFVALYPPREVAQALLDRLPSLDMPPHKLTPVEQLHLTLLFIGDTDLRQLDDVRESVERSCAGIGAFALAPLNLMVLPQRGPARLVACETSAPPELLEIHRRLVHRLARKPGDHQRFTPHMTLCRFAAPSRASVDQQLDPLADPAFPVADIRLVRSTLLAGGARHQPELVVRLEKSLPSPGG